MNKLRRKLAYLLQEIRSSYWFLPGVMVTVAFLLSLFAIELDRSAPKDFIDSLSWAFTDDPEAARVILSTIATATMGVAGVTFSMTLLAISFAASQIGQRILSGFMRDKGNQFTLGVFISTFVYCIMVLRTVYSSSSGQPFVPNLSIVLAIGFSILSIFVLIYFINHIPTMMNMTNSVNRTGKQLIKSIEIQFPKKMGQEADKDEDFFSKSGDPVEIRARGMGYIEYINYEVLLETCDEYDLLVEIVKKPGDFVSKEITVAHVYCSKEISNEVKLKVSETFIEGVIRSYEQDIRFPGNLLLEIAARALSPGINDPFTAMDCINQLQTGLLFMQNRDKPKRFRKGNDKKIRVVAEPLTYEEFLEDTLNSLRGFVKRDFICSRHLMQLIRLLNDSDQAGRDQIYKQHSKQLAQSFMDNTKDEMNIRAINDLRIS